MMPGTNLIILLAFNMPWLNERLGKFDLQVFNFADTGRGLATMRDRRVGEVLLEVSDPLTPTEILQRFKSIHSTAAAAQSLTNEQVLSLGILELKAINDDYALSLPDHQYSVLTIPSTLKQCFPRCYQASIEASQETAFQLYQQIKIHSKSPPSLADFLWAFSTVRSRSLLAPECESHPLLVDGSGSRILLPAFDILNHKDGAQSALELLQKRENEEVWRLTANEAYQAGDQVFISYGNRDNLKLFFTYGFCMRENSDNLALFDLDDLLEACKKIRPNLFSKDIIERIKPQLEAAVGTTRGEDRAMFSLDSKGPRESLMGGLNMMQQVSKQLSTVRDDEFMKDITKCLKDIRSEEIRMCLSKLETLDDLEKGWDNTKQFIRILLESEYSLLEMNC